MNDCSIKKFLIIIFTLQLLFWGFISLDLMGLKIPILRQLSCFIYLSFVPGILILRVIRSHKLGCIENLLYSVGLSLSFLMFVGFFMNKLYPLMGIKRPISIIPLELTVSFIVLLLCCLCYLIDRDYSDSNYIYLNNAFSAYSLFLCLIPILTIIGTYFMNLYSNNSLLMIVIFLISLIIFLVCFDLIPESLYPLAIFIATFSLLFHNSLISKYLVGWDIQIEYYIANKVIENSLWDPNITSNLVTSNVNSVLSIVMLAPIYSTLLNLDLIWVFKIIYPAILSLMPLGMYIYFTKQTDSKIAFISTFFFISLVVFYTEMLQLARQQIAEYFFMLIVLLIVKDKHEMSNKILLIIFSFSLVVSHYGLSYIFLGIFAFSLLISFLCKKYFCNHFTNNTINLSFGIFFSVFLLSWYLYTSNFSTMSTIVIIIKNIVETLWSEFLNPNMSQGMYVITEQANTPLHVLAKVIHLLTQIAISIGLFNTLYNFISRKKSQFSIEYLFLSLSFYLLLILAIIIPNFANALNVSRLYHITLIFLAPYCIIGFTFSLEALPQILKLNIVANRNKLLKILCTFFALFLLFNTGWIYVLVGDSTTSFSLNSTNDYPIFNEKETTGKEWLYEVIDPTTYKDRYIYADNYRWLIFLNRFDKTLVRIFPSSPQNIIPSSYIYLSTYNIVKNEVLIYSKKGVNNVPNYVFNEYSINKTQIYDNGGAKIYIQ